MVWIRHAIGVIPPLKHVGVANMSSVRKKPGSTRMPVRSAIAPTKPRSLHHQHTRLVSAPAGLPLSVGASRVDDASRAHTLVSNARF